jgi:hypothetical protein
VHGGSTIGGAVYIQGQGMSGQVRHVRKSQVLQRLCTYDVWAAVKLARSKCVCSSMQVKRISCECIVDGLFALQPWNFWSFETCHCCVVEHTIRGLFKSGSMHGQFL